MSGNTRGKRMLRIAWIKREIKSVSSRKLVVSQQRALFTRVLAGVRASEESGITHRSNDRHNVINFVSGDRARSGEARPGKHRRRRKGEQRSSISGQGLAGAAGWSPPICHRSPRNIDPAF